MNRPIHPDERAVAGGTSFRRRRRLALRFLPLLALLAVASCDEADNVFVDEIGTTRLHPTSPGLGQQAIKDSDRSMQAAVWVFSEATLNVNDVAIDLLIGSPCIYTDSAVEIPNSRQKCGNGIVVDSIDDVVEATVDLTFTMEFHRAEPVDLPPREDFDGDGVFNRADTCPLIANPDQEIEACSIIASTTGVFLDDSDADEIDDSRDNCIWIANPEQENTTSKLLFDDFIGDACPRETGRLELLGSSEIKLVDVPIDYTQSQDRLSYIVVEVDHRNGVTCDFDMGTCSISRKSVKVCQQHDPISALVGCFE